jgi:transcriptional regulator with XRE-family HTH domain
MTPSELRAIRERLGMTRADVCRALSLTDTAAAKWERGERPIPEHHAEALRGMMAEAGAGAGEGCLIPEAWASPWLGAVILAAFVGGLVWLARPPAT